MTRDGSALTAVTRLASFARTGPRAFRIAIRRAAVCAAALMCAWPAGAQTNFTPLERGDFAEEEERVTVLKGVEAHVQYALRMHDLEAGDAPPGLETSRLDQDLRLNLSTAFHRDIAVHLVLEVFQEPLTDGNIREQRETDRNRTSDGQTLGVNAREAYLRYNFNPNSGLLFGRQAVSIADRKGLVFEGIAPGITFQCNVGTWCMPFGGFRVSESTADWVYHWGLEYTAWDDRPQGELPSLLRVGGYRIYYSEQNIPLGRNAAPAYFDPEDPDVPVAGQQTDDAGNAIYYDAIGYAIFGLNVDWEARSVFGNLNWVNSQGARSYHRYRDGGNGIVGDMQFDDEDPQQKRRRKINGWALHGELGWRWLPEKKGLVGLRLLYATGDEDRSDRNNGRAFVRGLNGYYEIAPGSYNGTRLWFNGSDASVDGGGGLGHSVTNTRMYGVFLETHDPEGARIGYSSGLYNLYRVEDVRDTLGRAQDYIGLEWDNMLIWYFHKSARAQFELNLLQQGGAFSYDDYSAPDREKHLVVQTVARIVYEF